MDFVTYWNSLTWEKAFRIYWYFFIFELTRFVTLEYVVLWRWKYRRRRDRDKYQEATFRLFQEAPFVSIIVPGKNEGKHIYKLAKSLQNQTYRNFELIVIDDGSDDETEKICNTLSKNGFIDLFIRNYVRGGKASGANLAFRYSKGDIVVHLDADCSYSNDAIEKILVPFYFEPNIGAVGGNVQVRNESESLATSLQSIEYQNVIGSGRVVTSELGIYRIVSGAFGAFRRDILDRLGGWDIGPGLDGDITVKIRKLGYQVRFAPDALCVTSVPNTFRKLAKQRRRWDKSLIRFRVRKHKDVFVPNKAFQIPLFLSFVENVTFNLILNVKWYLYIVDMMINFSNMLGTIILMNLILYTLANYFKLIFFAPFRTSFRESWLGQVIYVPLSAIYTGYFLRIVRTYAYIAELLFKSSYKDPWNPGKTSFYAKARRI